jgi:CRISPR-associated protein Cas1
MKKIKNSIPFIYLEHGTLFRKDADIVFKNKESETHVPLDSFITIMLGPGVNFSSNAVSHIARNDCFIAISSSDQMPKVFLTTFNRIGNPEYSIKQVEIYQNRNTKLDASKKLIFNKFKDESFLEQKSTNELMLKEARVTKKMYRNIFGEEFTRNFSRDSDEVNRKINIGNNAVYNYCSAVIHLLGLSPHLGVLHGKKRNALVFDFSEIFKNEEYYNIINNTNDIKETLQKISIHCRTYHPQLMEYIEDVFGTYQESETD